MDINKLTTKSQEALRKSQELALTLGQQQVDVFHLLVALISQEGSVVPTVLRKIGVDIEKIKVDAMKEAEKYPKSPAGTLGQIFITPSLVQILEQAEKEMENIDDDYVSTEHLLL